MAKLYWVSIKGLSKGLIGLGPQLNSTLGPELSALRESSLPRGGITSHWLPYF